MKCKKYIPSDSEKKLTDHFLNELKLASTNIMDNLLHSKCPVADVGGYTKPSKFRCFLKRICCSSILLYTVTIKIHQFHCNMCDKIIPIKSRAVYYLRQLLSLDDEQFVISAYQAILQRTPETEALHNNLNALRSGEYTKLELLILLKNSKEAQQKLGKVKGLRKYIFLQKSAAMPLIGKSSKKLYKLLLLIDTSVINMNKEKIYYTNQLDQTYKTSSNNVQNSPKDRIGNRETTAKTLISSEQLRFDYYQKKVGDKLAEISAHIDDNNEKIKQAYQQIDNIQLHINEVIKQLKNDQKKYIASLTAQIESPLSSLTMDNEFIERFQINHSNAFRGSYEEIKQRLQVYLPYLQQSEIICPQSPVLDIASGRGEWLEIMLENNYPTKGVEFNQLLVEKSVQAGFDVVHADGLDYMQMLEKDSISVVISFHLIEHLPSNKLLGFIRESHRIIKPGGLIILETPNPENIFVGSCNFYLDFTHIKPLPPQLLEFLLKEFGFKIIEVKRLHPRDEVQVKDEQIKLISDYLYSAQDYAIIGEKI